MSSNRKRLTNVKMIKTTLKDIALAEGQCFYCTPKAYEVWQESFQGEPALRLIYRIPRKRIFWVIEK